MSQDGFTYKATRSEYKGHITLVLSSGTNERYPFSFGVGKARRILACLDDIRRFVNEEGPKADAKAAKKKAAEQKQTPVPAAATAPSPG